MINSDAVKVLEYLETIKEVISNNNIKEKNIVILEMVGRIKIINDKYIKEKSLVQQPYWD